MEEIGCHFKFEKIAGNTFHNTDLLLSSGRNCLRYIIRERELKKIYLPYFLCESLGEVANKENIEIIYYHVDENLMPINIGELNEHEYIYIVNYYGMLKDEIKSLINRYKYVILDNTHDFFNKEEYDSDVIYNYRKYFGVPDGACIVSNNLRYNPKYPKGKSKEKVIEMILRDETGEFFHYPTFEEADKHFKNEDLCYMSNFTENFLHAIDYEDVLEQRKKNYKVLSNILKKYNRFELDCKDITYMYPLFVEKQGEDIRIFLKKNNIYSLKLWANMDWNGANSHELSISDNVVLLPIDQRYKEDDMEYIGNTINKFYTIKK